MSRIDGQEVLGLSPEELHNLMLGPRGTSVKLDLASQRTYSVELTRGPPRFGALGGQQLDVSVLPAVRLAGT